MWKKLHWLCIPHIANAVSTGAGISGILSWDEMVMMPQGSAGSRAAQKSALAGVLHDRRTDPKIGELAASLAKAGDLGEWEAGVVREAARM